ncbi:hypothetical protein EON79_16475 [bacterium]|nr:MAG: hypothetical protein EON79_16475 [bacterium]
MESPPMYTPPPKKSKTGLIIGLVVLAVLVCCGGPTLALLGGGLWALNKTQGFIGCSFSLPPIHRAALAFAEEKGKLPSAANWESEIKPYYEKEIAPIKEKQKMFKTIPPEGPFGCSEQSGMTGIALNTAVAGKKLDTIKDKSTPLFFEVPKPGKNLAQAYKPVPYDQSPGTVGTDHRGWFILPIDGTPKLVGKDGKTATVTGDGSSMNFGTD